MKGRLKGWFQQGRKRLYWIETTLSDGLPFSEGNGDKAAGRTVIAISDGLPFSEGNGDIVPVRPEFFFEHGRQFPVEIPRAVGHLQCAAGTMEGKPPAV